MKKLISRRNFLAAMGTVAAAGVLTACGGSSNSTASSAAASSTAASAAESWGDVKLTMWGAEAVSYTHLLWTMSASQSSSNTPSCGSNVDHENTPSVTVLTLSLIHI